MFGKGGLGNMMKQAQQMQEKMQQAQEEIGNLEVTAEAGAGMVKVTMTGRHDVKRVEIDPSLMEDDKDLLESIVGTSSQSGRPPNPAEPEQAGKFENR